MRKRGGFKARRPTIYAHSVQVFASELLGREERAGGESGGTAIEKILGEKRGKDCRERTRENDRESESGRKNGRGNGQKENQREGLSNRGEKQRGEIGRERATRLRGRAREGEKD